MGIKDRFRLDGIFRAERESLFRVFLLVSLFFTSFSFDEKFPIKITTQDKEKFRLGCCS